MTHFLGIILLGVSAWAEVPESQDPPAEEPRVVFKKQERISFEGLKLRGELKKPDLTYIYKRKGLRDEKIVNIPEDFHSEIIQGTGQF